MYLYNNNITIKDVASGDAVNQWTGLDMLMFIFLYLINNLILYIFIIYKLI